MLVSSGVLVLVSLALLALGVTRDSIALVYLSLAGGALAAASVTIGVRRHRGDLPPGGELDQRR